MSSPAHRRPRDGAAPVAARSANALPPVGGSSVDAHADEVAPSSRPVGLVGEPDQRVVAHQGPRLGVVEDEADLLGRQPPVDRHGDGAEVVGGEDRRQELDAVVREQPDDVAGADAPRARGRRRAPAARSTIPRVGDDVVAVDGDRLVGRAARRGARAPPTQLMSGLHRRDLRPPCGGGTSTCRRRGGARRGSGRRTGRPSPRSPSTMRTTSLMAVASWSSQSVTRVLTTRWRWGRGAPSRRRPRAGRRGPRRCRCPGMSKRAVGAVRGDDVVGAAVVEGVGVGAMVARTPSATSANVVVTSLLASVACTDRLV